MPIFHILSHHQYTSLERVCSKQNQSDLHMQWDAIKYISKPSNIELPRQIFMEQETGIYLSFIPYTCANTHMRTYTHMNMHKEESYCKEIQPCNHIEVLNPNPMNNIQFPPPFTALLSFCFLTLKLPLA
jgi:hypothetical protein